MALSGVPRFHGEGALHRSMHFRSGERAFRLCEAVRVRIGPDVVLTFCNAQANAACPRGGGGELVPEARTPVQTEYPCFLYDQDVSNGTPTLMDNKAAPAQPRPGPVFETPAPISAGLAPAFFWPS